MCSYRPNKAAQKAVSRGDLELLKDIAAKDTHVLAAPPCYMDTLLHRAARHLHCHIIEYLLDKSEIPINIRNAAGHTPLHEAVLAVGNDDCTLHRSNGESCETDGLHGDCSKDEATDDSCNCAYLQTLQLLIRRGADVLAFKHADWTTLHLLATRGTLPCAPAAARLLIQHGALLLARNKDGWTPFHVACRRAKVELLELLSGGDEDVRRQVVCTASNTDRTPLMTACHNGNLAAIELILRHAPEEHRRVDSCGWTAGDWSQAGVLFGL